MRRQIGFRAWYLSLTRNMIEVDCGSYDMLVFVDYDQSAIHHISFSKALQC